MSAVNGPKPLRHKTLSAYYPHLLTLEAYLSPNCDSLIYHSDPEEYRHLLKSTICAIHTHALGTFPTCTTQQLSFQDVIDRVLSDLAHARGRHANVLLAGCRVTTHGGLNVSRPAVESRHVGTPSTEIRSQAWRILHSRLGDAGFRFLFLTTSMFLLLENNCYLQLSGCPVHELYSHSKAEAPRSVRKRSRNDDDIRSRKKRRKTTTGETPSVRPAKQPCTVDIHRQRMFFGRPPRSSRGKILYGLPRNHVLNEAAGSGTPPTDNACMKVLKAVFASEGQLANGGVGIRGSLRRVGSMVGAMRELVARHARLDYASLLRHCLERLKEVDLNNYPSLVDGGASQKPPVSQAAPQLKHVTHSQVGRFVTWVLRDLLSTHLVGSQHNLDVIVHDARKLVSSKMYEPISLHSLVQGLRINDITWLALGEGRRVPPQEAAKRRQLMEQFIFWLFHSYIIPLLRASFYITDSAATRYETVYYAHSDWLQSTEPHLRLLEASLLEKLDKRQREKALKGPLGVSVVRLIPKPNGFRPIVNLGRRVLATNSIGVTSAGKTNMSTNQMLRNIHQVLTFEKNRNRAALGSCLFGTNEVFAPLQGLKSELFRVHGKLPKLYFVKMDIKAAFDSIKQDKMLEVMDHLLSKSEDYRLMLYCLLLPPASKASQGSARRLFKWRAAPGNGDEATSAHNARGLASQLRNAVLVDLVRRQDITREECMDLLRTHIQNNVWQVGTNLFRQKTGIPQGSKISSLLCSFFYSYLENEYLSWTRRRGTRLLRYIDDFLLVTDDYSLARHFVQVMSKGFENYGAFVSPSKTLLSFELAPGGQAAPVAAIGDNGSCYIPYCGFLIDTKTLDMSIDHERLTAAPTRQSFALRSNRNRGAGFVGWLSRQLENRNHVAFLDTQHNDSETVHLNIFINFALTAMKIPLYFINDIDQRTASLIHRWLCMAIEYTYSAGRARVRHAARGDTLEHYAVAKRTFVYLATAATRRTLARKASRFHHVVHSLDLDLSHKDYRTIRRTTEKTMNRGWEMIRHALF